MIAVAHIANVIATPAGISGLRLGRDCVWRGSGVGRAIREQLGRESLSLRNPFHFDGNRFDCSLDSLEPIGNVGRN
jgi:hypothetical protein